MKLTRAGFLALITGGVVGAQEPTATHDTLEGKAPECDSPWVYDTKANAFAPMTCAPGFEYCPMQHWQKPKYIRTSAYDILAEPADQSVEYHVPGNTEGQSSIFAPITMERPGYDVHEEYVNQRICSTCGIVYFNPKDLTGEKP